MSDARKTNHGQTAMKLVEEAARHLRTVTHIERVKGEGGYPPMEGDGSGIIGELTMARRRLKQAKEVVKAAIKEEVAELPPLPACRRRRLTPTPAEVTTQEEAT